MSLFHAIRHRWYVLTRGEAYAREQEQELAFLVDMERRAREHEGLTVEEAAHAVRRDFGSVTYYREETRRMSILGRLDVIRQDARYAWRTLLRSPSFTITV